MTLEPHEIQSALWVKLKTELEARIELQRKRNDGDLNEIETARLRGIIFAYKNLLALAEPPTPVTTGNDHFD